MLVFWRVFKKYKKFIFAVMAAALIGGYLFSAYDLSQNYQAKAVLMVTGANDPEVPKADYMSILANKQLVRTYSWLVPTTTVLGRVSREFKPNITVEELRNAIKVRQIGDTELLEISVLAATPGQAASIANITAEVFIRYVNEELQLTNVKLVDPAVQNRRPVESNVVLKTLAFTVSGFILAFMGCLLFDYMRRPSNKDEDK